MCSHYKVRRAAPPRGVTTPAWHGHTARGKRRTLVRASVGRVAADNATGCQLQLRWLASLVSGQPVSSIEGLSGSGRVGGVGDVDGRLPRPPVVPAEIREGVHRPVTGAEARATDGSGSGAAPGGPGRGREVAAGAAQRRKMLRVIRTATSRKTGRRQVLSHPLFMLQRCRMRGSDEGRRSGTGPRVGGRRNFRAHADSA